MLIYAQILKNSMDPLEFESRISAMSRRRQFGIESINKPQNGTENFSNFAGNSEGNPIQSDGLVSVADIFRMYEDEFRAWVKKGAKPLSLSTEKSYCNALTSFGTSIYLPSDVQKYHEDNEVYISEKFGKGWGKFKKFIKLNYPSDSMEINGFRSFDTYSDKITAALNNAEKAENRDNIAHDLTPAQFREFASNIPKSDDESRMVFQLLAYTGARLSQLVSIWKEHHDELPGLVEEVDAYPNGDESDPVKVVRIDVSKFGADRKRTGKYYLPEQFLDDALEFEPTKSYVNYQTVLENAGASVDAGGKVVSAKTLRKWLTNLMIKSKIPAEIAGWIEGRVPNKHNSASAVTWNSYGDLDQYAADAYATVEPKILTIAPLDMKYGDSSKSE